MPKTKAILKDPMDAVLRNIEKQMGNKGKPSFSRFKNIKSSDMDVISFGIPEIDEASYCGGIPRGKMIEVYGPESSGKSLLSLYLIASAQKAGLDSALVDVEQAFDPVWAATHGVNVDDLVWGNDFDNGEQALEYTFQLCKSKAFGLVVIDSTAALTPKSELEGSLEDNARVGEQARILSRGVRKIRAACGSTDTTCVFINQIRMMIGVVYGNPETTPGGKALKFYSDQRIRVSSKAKIKIKEDGQDVVIGQISKVTFVKNRVGRPFGSAEFKIIFDAKALNPVVMLVNEARSAKLIRPYKGIFRINKGVFGKESIETGTTTMVELADYLIEKGLVLDMLDKLEEAVEEDDLPAIDGAILEMREDASKIVSPTGNVTFEASKVSDVDPEDIAEDISDDEDVPEEVE